MALITSSGARGRCPVCGADRHMCGEPSHVTPVDAPIYTKERRMTEPTELGDYTWEQNGQEMTGRLSAADAERLGARPAGENADTGDGADGGDEGARTKARKAQNK